MNLSTSRERFIASLLLNKIFTGKYILASMDILIIGFTAV